MQGGSEKWGHYSWMSPECIGNCSWLVLCLYRELFPLWTGWMRDISRGQRRWSEKQKIPITFMTQQTLAKKKKSPSVSRLFREEILVLQSTPQKIMQLDVWYFHSLNKYLKSILCKFSNTNRSNVTDFNRPWRKPPGNGSQSAFHRWLLVSLFHIRC